MSSTRTRAAKRDSAKPLEPTVPKRDSQSAGRAESSPPPAKPPIDHGPQAKFTYLLKAWTAERRSDGWYVASRQSGAAHWSGPFADMENAILSIARGLCYELADRHTRHIEQFKLTANDGRYGLKPTTRLKPKSKSNGSVA